MVSDCRETCKGFTLCLEITRDLEKVNDLSCEDKKDMQKKEEKV